MSTKTRERPILFSAPMVRALLAGTKTQTRRVVKWRGLDKGLNLSFTGLRAVHDRADLWALESDSRTSVEHRCDVTPCPYGQPGDRLWVRETWGYIDPDCSGDGSDDDEPEGPGAFCDELLQDGHPLRDFWRRRVDYRATWQDPKYGIGPDAPKRWRSSIHMPHWASRITLEVTGVRVERLRDISRGDAMDEGCPFPNMAKGDDPRRWYAGLWDDINGAGSWATNPWAWVVQFRRLP